MRYKRSKYIIIYKAKVNTGSISVLVGDGGGTLDTTVITDTEFVTKAIQFTPTDAANLYLYAALIGVGEELTIEILSIKK